MDQGSGVCWMRKEVFVGLDYATAFVQVCVLDELGQVLAKGRCENHWAELDAFVRRFAATPRAALEACPGAANLADELVAHANGSIDLAHPGYVQRMKPSPDKTDFTAARMLAGLVRVGYLPRVWLAPETVRALRRLVRRRQALVERRRALKLQVSGWLREVRVRSPEGRRWTQRWQAWLKTVPLPSETRWVIDDVCVELAAVQRHVARVERRLAQVARRDVMVQRMRGAPGIGLITACVLRAEIGDATRFRTGKQLSPFCGRTPSWKNAARNAVSLWPRSPTAGCAAYSTNWWNSRGRRSRRDQDGPLRARKASASFPSGRGSRPSCERGVDGDS
jgi:transposase